MTLALLVVLGVSFHNFSFTEPEVFIEDCLSLPTEVFSQTDKRGKLKHARELDEVFTLTPWDALGFPRIDEKMELALQHQLQVLESSKFKDGQKVGNLRMNYEDLKTVIEVIARRVKTNPDDLHQYLDAYQVKGDDGRGNVYFTGYYTPALKVKSKKDRKYKYPLYAFPDEWSGKMPSRKDIDRNKVLAGQGLELAYAANPFDVYMMQLQGSGTVEFLDTKKRMLFRYAGENGHPYRNIEHFFKRKEDISIGNLSPDGMRRFLNKNPHLMDSVLSYNPSYVFFAPKRGKIKGAGQVPLIEDVSIAVDTRYFPYGSVVLAAVPVYKNNKVTHHEYRILLPHDIGGAIKGPGHVDMYFGEGDSGRAKASAMHSYGRIWILMPKKNEQVAMN